MMRINIRAVAANRPQVVEQQWFIAIHHVPYFARCMAIGHGRQ